MQAVGADSGIWAMQAVNEDGKLAWSRITVFGSFYPREPGIPFLRMTTAAGQVCAGSAKHKRPLVPMPASIHTAVIMAFLQDVDQRVVPVCCE